MFRSGGGGGFWAPVREYHRLEKGPTVSVRVRRVYDPPEPGDGVRVLVDRLWPRGVSRQEARIDEWPRAMTPSTGLRRWYHSGEGSYEEFRRRYEAELAEPEAAELLEHFRKLSRQGPVTLVTASRAPQGGHAAVLAGLLEK
ncbi:DUF488 family protein [Streptomyces thermogriseus]|uniref:DUF488 family protein n=1 Tax=Streptomyces thermogriseus TaxID=75292 RepID=A0ABN1T0Z2_9ACTN